MNIWFCASERRIWLGKDFRWTSDWIFWYNFVHARDTCKLFWSRFFLVVVDTDLSLLLKAYSLLYSCCSNIKSLCIKTMSSLSSLRKVVNGGTKLKNQQPLEVNKIEMTEPSLFYEFFLYSMRWLLITFFISILKAQIWWHQYKIFSGSKRVRSVIHLL